MKKIYLKSPKNFIIEDSKNRKLNEGELLIKVKSMGICGTDVIEYNNYSGAKKIVLGHEFGGIVTQFKNAPKDIKIGDKVAVFPLFHCGKCYYCNKGLELYCENRNYFGSPDCEGAMMEEKIIPFENCVKVPEHFNDKHLALIEPTTVALHALNNFRDSNIMVVGVGSIGMLILEIGILNNNKVFAVDIDDKNLELAKELGASQVFNFNTLNTTRDMTYLVGSKIDIIILTVGNQKIWDWALNSIRKNGTIVNIAITKSSIKIDLFNLIMKAIKVINSEAYYMHEFERATKLISDKKIIIDAIISKEYPLLKASEAFKYKDKNNCLKVILTN